MKRFEYKQINRPYNKMETAADIETEREQRIDWLNEYGRAGWEVIKIDFDPSGTVAFIKRRIDE